jgi:hypothetical protein
MLLNVPEAFLWLGLRTRVGRPVTYRVRSTISRQCSGPEVLSLVLSNVSLEYPLLYIDKGLEEWSGHIYRRSSGHALFFFQIFKVYH